MLTVKFKGLPTTAVVLLTEVKTGATPIPTATVTRALSRAVVTDPAPVAELAR